MKRFLLAMTLAGVALVCQVRAADKKVKVFLLAGQSNMEGHGQVRSLDHLGKHPKYGHLLKKLKSAGGSWATRKDVTVSWKARNRLSGPLTVGWGDRPHEIGPELMFGTIMGEKYDQPVLLIKTAWGGKDVFCDFRSPSAGKPTGDDAAVLARAQAKSPREVGRYYRTMVADIKYTLANIKAVVPGYKGQGYEIAGLAWFQGWNDFCEWHVRVAGKRVGLGVIRNYPRNLAAMFRDIRKDLKAPDMPIVIGELGIGGRKIAEKAKDKGDHEAQAIVDFRAAQRAVGADKSLENVTFVPTAEYWDDRLQELRVISNAYWGEKQKKGIKDTESNHLPTKKLNDEFLRLGQHWYCHYNGSAANYSLVGYALAEALIKMRNGK